MSRVNRFENEDESSYSSIEEKYETSESEDSNKECNYIIQSDSDNESDSEVYESSESSCEDQINDSSSDGEKNESSSDDSEEESSTDLDEYFGDKRYKAFHKLIEKEYKGNPKKIAYLLDCYEYDNFGIGHPDRFKIFNSMTKNKKKAVTFRK